VPKVLAALSERMAVPWWQHAWWRWPAAAQAAFVAVALLVVAAFSSGGSWFDDSVTGYSQQVSERLTPLSSAWETLASLFGTGALLWEKAGQPLLLHGLLVAGALYLICIGLGTMFFRVAFKRV
jgi:hypothetical protein